MVKADLPTELLELLREEWPRTKLAVGPLSSSALAQYRSLLFAEPCPAHKHRFAALLQLAHDHISAQPYASVSTSSRRFYTEVGLLWSLVESLTPMGRSGHDWEDSIARLDRVLIIAGAPDRIDLVLTLIECIQTAHLPLSPLSDPQRYQPRKRARASSPSDTLTLAPTAIPRLETPPSMAAYIKNWLDKPFILPSYLAHMGWPALTDPAHRWKDGDYLLRLAGRGRIVPVEIDATSAGGGGGGYTDTGWGQALLPWDEFLRRSGFVKSSPALDDTAGSVEDNSNDTQPPLYLAQHDLFFQFPPLVQDVLTPDYVYSCPPTTSYTPPTTDSGVVTNVWVGGAGRGSPAHTDPFYNCYGQVVGRKRVFLVPPHHHAAMYPYSMSAPEDAADGNGDAVAEGATSLMSNTSRVPLLQAHPPPKGTYPRFYGEALPDALEGVLEEGDMLVMPVGWWHAMRMEGGPGWGVSFWY